MPFQESFPVNTNINIRDYDKKSLMKKIAFVFQSSKLFKMKILSKTKKDFKKTMDNKENAHLQVAEKVNYVALFIKGFLLNFINIGVLGFWLGIIIVFGPKLDMNASRIFVFFTSIILAYFGIDIIKILIAKKLKNRLTAFHIYKIKRAISIILLVFGVFLILQAFFPNVLQLTN